MDFNPLSIFTDPQMRELCAELTALGIEKATQTAQKRELDQATRASLLTQVQLRHQACTKLGPQALEMFFTRDGLEQATRSQIAQLHAERFVVAGATHVADLGCGNGVDARAFASAGLAVSAWDLDVTAHAAATLNLSAFPRATTHLGDVTQLSMDDLATRGVDAIFADPARRTGSGKGSQRVSAPEDWSPSLPQVLAWRSDLQRLHPTERLGMKLAPGIEHRYLPADMEAQWISVDGALLEASLWSPACSFAGAGRRATIFRGQQVTQFFASTDPAQPAPEIPEGGELKRYLWEADPAIIRAGLLHLVAESSEATVVSKGIAYLLTDHLPNEQWARAVTVYELLETAKLKPKAVAARLRELGATNVEVKKRGAEIDPAAWQRNLLKALKLKKTSAENPVTVVATRFNGDHLAILTRRL